MSKDNKITALQNMLIFPGVQFPLNAQVLKYCYMLTLIVVLTNFHINSKNIACD